MNENKHVQGNEPDNRLQVDLWSQEEPNGTPEQDESLPGQEGDFVHIHQSPPQSFCTCGGDHPTRTLAKPACTKIQNQIDSANVFKIMKFAKLIGDNHLQRQTQNYLVSNFDEISKESSDFLNLEFEEITALIRQGSLHVKNKECLFKAVLRWVSHNAEYRKYKAAQLLSSFHDVSLNNFERNLKIPHHGLRNTCPLAGIHPLEQIVQSGRKTTAQLQCLPNVTCPRPNYRDNEMLFTFGGISEDERLDDNLIVEFYDSKANKWVGVDQHEESRAYHGAVTMGCGSEVAIIGGCCCEASDSLVYLNSCRAYDTATKNWRELAPLQKHRGFLSVAAFGNFIYALGGVGLNKQVLNSVEEYDISQDKWLTIEPMHTKRAQACATSLKDKVYVMGGWNEQDWLRTLECYDRKTNQWTLMSSMLEVRAGASCVTYKNCVYVIAGYNGHEVAKSGEHYDPEKDSWTRIPDMFEPISEFSMTVFQEKIYCIGGEKCEDNSYFLTDDVVCYDAASHQWKKMVRIGVPRHALSACVVKFPCLTGCSDQAV